MCCSLLEWENVLSRRVRDCWKLSFDMNPIANASYKDLSLRAKILILKALCDWKLQDDPNILSFIESMDDASLQTLRPKPIGQDDHGGVYWYFGDECWVYCERNLIEQPIVYVFLANRRSIK